MTWTEQEQKAIDTAIRHLGEYGTDRVITSARGTTVPYSYAVKDFGISVEFVYIRNDGWTLGCHRVHQSVAYGLWKDEWIAVIIKPETQPRHIRDVVAMRSTELESILPRMDSFPKRVRRPTPGGVKGVWSYVGKEGTEEVEEEAPE